MNSPPTPPKVSVCVITFNQGAYIRECLQSIVDQETPFPFEVIVGDDCSTDETRAIVQEFAARYPDIVKPIFHSTHVGGTRNLLLVYDRACGDLIAHIDGDDYMLPGKLRIQAEELDKNPDCAMCVHAMKHFDQARGRYRTPIVRGIPRKGSMAFLLMHLPYFAHSSKMYRAECRDGLETGGDEILDCYFHVHHALRGDILYLPQLLGVYRLNVGVSTAEGTQVSAYKVPKRGMLEEVIRAIDYARRRGVAADLVTKAKARCYFGYAYAHLLAKDFATFQTLVKRSYATATVSNVQRLFNALSSSPRLLFLLVRVREGLRALV